MVDKRAKELQAAKKHHAEYAKHTRKVFQRAYGFPLQLTDDEILPLVDRYPAKQRLKALWDKCMDYHGGDLPPHYPVPAIRLDIVYWDCGGISISVPGEMDHCYTYGRAFGHGTRINYWEP